MSLLTLLIVLLVLAVLFGSYGSYRGGWGPYGWSPFGILLLILLVLLLTGSIHAQTEAPHCTANGPLPDPVCNPGVLNEAVTPETLATTICVSGWTATIRPPVSYTNRVKVQAMIDYGMVDVPMQDVELDHLVALSSGGHPSDPSNLWPELWARPDGLGAHAKDAVENASGRAACRGTVPLATLQQGMATNWVALGIQLGVPGLGVVVPTPGTE